MITFVTAYLFPEKHLHICEEFSMKNLIALCKEKLRLVLFVYPEDEEWIRRKLENTEGRAMPLIYTLQKTDLKIWNLIHEDLNYELPGNRNTLKDTREYLWKTHIPFELLKKTIEKNPFQTSHFSWISYSARFLIKKQSTFTYLRDLTNFKKGLLLPGCMANTVNDVSELLDDICWRFSGGFFVGDAESIINMYEVYVLELEEFLKIHRKIIWEVNFYAYLERYCKEWKASWYYGNHDDSMITNISAFYFSNCLAEKKSYRCVDYNNVFQIEGFYPTSACYLQHYDVKKMKNIKYLNIRYVNYWLYPNGYYRYPSSKHLIDNKNMICELDEYFYPILSTCFVMQESMDLTDFSNSYSHGLEDIRIYEIDGKIKCSATNLNYVDSGSGRSRIIVSDYSVDRCVIDNGVIINPPNNTWCEKNWIPIVHDGKECFIYKWCPFQIGEIQNNDLKIIYEYPIECPLFRNVRGSSLFVHIDREYSIGVVHFSEEGSPRKYCHMLVEMKDNVPIHYSQPFCFREFSVEFCIGFTIDKDNYIFWISQMDRDPLMIMVNKEEILCNNNIY
jgi:hypothetical protein